MHNFRIVEVNARGRTTYSIPSFLSPSLPEDRTAKTSLRTSLANWIRRRAVSAIVVRTVSFFCGLNRDQFES